VFDWNDFLDLAETLAAEPNSEAAARSAISRAYYATFHAGREYLVRASIPLDRSRNAHLQVQEKLLTQSAEIAQNVLLLHVWRKKADYDNAFATDMAEQANSAVALAKQTVERIKALQ
jgi:uncharacterized protein (UPF0332 family)